jgi:hypothetical protein
MGDQKRLWRATAAFGVLTIITALWFLTRGMPACDAPPLASAMLDFEMAVTQAEFATVLDCAPRLAELDYQNIVDLLLFMWVYTGMLTAFMLAVGVRRGIALGLAALMLGGDFIETALLRQIAAGWPQLDPTLVSVLAVAVRVKFAAIGLAMLVGAARLWRLDGWGGKLTALLVVVGGIASLAIIPPEARGPASQILVVGWLAILGYASVNALRSPRPAPSSAGA